MKTVNAMGAEMEEIKKAAEIIRKGGLGAFPAETAYGLGLDSAPCRIQFWAFLIAGGKKGYE